MKIEDTSHLIRTVIPHVIIVATLIIGSFLLAISFKKVIGANTLLTPLGITRHPRASFTLKVVQWETLERAQVRYEPDCKSADSAFSGSNPLPTTSTKVKAK